MPKLRCYGLMGDPGPLLRLSVFQRETTQTNLFMPPLFLLVNDDEYSLFSFLLSFVRQQTNVGATTHLNATWTLQAVNSNTRTRISGSHICSSRDYLVMSFIDNTWKLNDTIYSMRETRHQNSHFLKIHQWLVITYKSRIALKSFTLFSTVKTIMKQNLAHSDKFKNEFES